MGRKSENMTPWEREYRRYNRIYNLVIVLWLLAFIVVWWFAGWFWGIVCLAFGIWSSAWYENGAMDEYEYAYPKYGFRLMFKSWPWFIVLAGIAYFLCQAYMPWLFSPIKLLM